MPLGYDTANAVTLKTLKPFRRHSKDEKIPINKAGLFSYLLVTWMTPLVWYMFRKRKEQLTEDDIWECSDHEMSKTNTERMKRLWDEELAKRGPEKASVLRMWFIFTRTRMFVTFFVVWINATAAFLESGFLLELIISYLESSNNDLVYGLALVATMMVANIVRAFSICVVLLLATQTGVRFRAGYFGLAYDKLLRLRNLQGKTLAEMITLYGPDGYRVLIFNTMFVYIMALPVYLIIGTLYTYYLIGPLCFIALGVFLICYQLQAFLTGVVVNVRKKVLIYTDKRIRKMTEVLNSMKLIKMYAWESSFKESVEGIREKEKKFLLLSAIISSINGAIIPVTPTLASVASIATYRAIGYELTASKAFAVVGTLNFLRGIVTMMPHTSRAFAEANVSFQRMKKLLLMEEFDPPTTECNDSSNTIEIIEALLRLEKMDQQTEKQIKKAENASEKKREIYRRISFDKGSVQPTRLNVAVKKGKLIGICGAVGSGKSSLLAAMLGRIPLDSGHLAVAGRVAYVPDQAWVFNGTLKENILFGKEYDIQRYQQVIYVCGLEPDLAILVNGDKTEIGDRGTNLSGGQKQRVSLARAVYSNSDVYLLDDPLSAVDVHVGNHLFHKCIKKALNGKTIILTTHQLQYLKHCDEIWVMKDGNIIEKGDNESLVKLSSNYGDMIAQFNATTVSPPVAQGNESITTKDADADVNDQGDKSVVSSLSQKPEGVELESFDKRKKSIGGRLTESEEIKVGSVKFSTYKSYSDAAGGFMVTCFVLLCYVAALGSVVLSDWWLSIWIDSIDMSNLYGSEINNKISTPSWTADYSFNQTSTNTNLNDPVLSTFTTTAYLGNVSMDTVPQTPVIDIYLLVYVAFIGGIILLTLIKGVIGAMATVTASNEFHRKAFDNIMKAKIQFFDANPVGRILNRFSKDLDEGDVHLPLLIDIFLQTFFMLVFSILTNAIALPWMLIALFPVTLLYGILKAISSIAVTQLKRIENKARSPMLSHLNISAQGLDTILTFKQQKNFFDTNFACVDVTSSAHFLFESSIRWIGIRLDLTSTLITLATSLALVFTKGTVSAAVGGLGISMCVRILSLIQLMMRLVNEAEARFTSIERINQYAKEVESEPDEGEVVPDKNWPGEGKIIFSDVVMRYREDMDPVLRNINFIISSKEKVGVIGRTGAGKSSLASALFRLVPLSSGHIYIDDVDISHIPLYSLRSKVSTIPQDPILFAGTLRYNLDPFDTYSDDKIWDALEKVQMKEKVLLFDNQLESCIQENGENFSVGERQLICLARAILRKNKILLLDEATASIDTSTDTMIQQTIRENFSDCTVITIAHRLSTVLHCDKIMIMEEGKVIEMGKPEELQLDPNSHFHSMVAAQNVKHLDERL